MPGIPRGADAGSSLGFGLGVGYAAAVSKSSIRKMLFQDGEGMHYLLVDEVLVVLFDAEVALALFERAPLFKDLSIKGQRFTMLILPVLYKHHQVTSLLQFLPQFLQFLRHLSISASSLSDLSDFASSETDVRV